MGILFLIFVIAMIFAMPKILKMVWEAALGAAKLTVMIGFVLLFASIACSAVVG